MSAPSTASSSPSTAGTISVSSFNSTTSCPTFCRDALDAREILEKVGLGERMNNFPAQLSGGEQQRVSIARAVAKKPKILLCDEPTGALDYETGKHILKLLSDMCREFGTTVIVVTHNSALKDMADRVVYIKNGAAERSEFNPSPKDISEIEW